MSKILQKTLAILLIFSFCGCSAADRKPEAHSSRFFAMDTVMEISVYSEEDSETLLNACRNRVTELDGLLSFHNASGDIWKLNHSSGSVVAVSPDTLTVLRASSEICGLSCGAFNIATGALTELWGFETDSPSIPDGQDLRALGASDGGFPGHKL